MGWCCINIIWNLFCWLGRFEQIEPPLWTILLIVFAIILIGIVSWNISMLVWNIGKGESFENQSFDFFPNFLHILFGITILLLCAIFSSPCLICISECKLR